MSRELNEYDKEQKCSVKENSEEVNSGEDILDEVGGNR